MSIRDKILGSKKNFTTVNFDFEGSELLIREPSIFEVNHANNLRFVDDEKGNLKVKDNAHLDITLFYLVNLVTDKDGKKIFEQTDKDTLLSYPAYSEIARLINEVWNVVRGEYIKKKPLEQLIEI